MISIFIKNVISKKRNNKDFIKSGINVSKSYFLLGKFEKCIPVLQNILKAQPKNLEALYLQGMCAFFTYRTEKSDKLKKEKIKIAETSFLGIFTGIFNKKMLIKLCKIHQIYCQKIVYKYYGPY